MTRIGRCLCLLLLAACLVGPASGCFGLTQNPSYFPYLHPTLDVVETHAKPVGLAYYANFDPHAVKLIVQPLEQTSQVRTQHVILATVYDEKNVPRRARRVEWKLEGVGSIIEADEHGCTPGRGWTKKNEAVTYTNYTEHRMNRGNANAADDFMVRPGQTWCVVSSPVEGDSYITLVAPGVHDWDKRVVHAVIRWVDATWEFPPPAAVRFGTDHVMTTKVFRHTDRKPLKGYEVRYKILDGPPAVFAPSNTQEFTAVSDLAGNAQVGLRQAAPIGGINRIGIEIIRPPDPTAPSGAGVLIARAETTVEWLAPMVALAHAGPPSAVLNQEVIFTTSASNSGRIESRSMTITAAIPDGTEFVRANPPAVRDGNNLVWTFGTLPPGQNHSVQAVYTAKRPGPIRSVALLATEEGFRDQKEAVTTITAPDLKVSINAPPTAVVNTPIPFKVMLSNPGAGPLDKIFLVAAIPPGLTFRDPTDNKDKELPTLNVNVDGLAAGQSREETLVLTAIRPGKYTVGVTASSSGLSDQAKHVVDVTQPQVELEINGPQRRFVGRPADYTIRVSNPTDAPLSNVEVRNRLPAELEFKGAPQGGVFANGEVVWKLGTLQPRTERILEVTTLASRPVAVAEQVAVVTTDGLRREAKATLEIQGLGALQLSLTDLNDPVEVGTIATYRLEVVNTGTAPLNRIVVKATAPPELRPTKATGPSRDAIAGQVITFDPVDNVAPGTKITFIIECTAEKAGDARFVAEVTSEANAEPIRREEPTRVITPFAAPNPPPPPNGGEARPLPKG